MMEKNQDNMYPGSDMVLDYHVYSEREQKLERKDVRNMQFGKERNMNLVKDVVDCGQFHGEGTLNSSKVEYRTV